MYYYRHKYYLLITLLISMRIQMGSTIKCYVCSDMVSLSACKDPFLRNVDIQDCGDELLCGKVKMTEKPGNFTRGCLPPDYCVTKKTNAFHCSTCDTHLCNTGSSLIRNNPFMISTMLNTMLLFATNFYNIL